MTTEVMSDINSNSSVRNLPDSPDCPDEKHPRFHIIGPEAFDSLPSDSPPHNFDDTNSLGGESVQSDNPDAAELRKRLEAEVRLSSLNGRHSQSAGAINPHLTTFTNFLSVPGANGAGSFAGSRTVSMMSVSEAGSTCVESPEFEEGQVPGEVLIGTRLRATLRSDLI